MVNAGASSTRIAIVIGAAPHRKRMLFGPPLLAAAIAVCRATRVQLDGVPSPTRRTAARKTLADDRMTKTKLATIAATRFMRFFLLGVSRRVTATTSKSRGMSRGMEQYC